MSYVPLINIGCSVRDNPWSYYSPGVNTRFMYPQTIANVGPTTNIPAAVGLQEGQAFYADQIRLGGWNPEASKIYHALFSTSYPGQFLPENFNIGMHVDVNNQVVQYNMGQIFLNNAFCWTFIKFPNKDIGLVPFNRMDPASYMVPIFINPVAFPTGINNKEELLVPINKANKWGKLIQAALIQARAANDGFGPCGNSLIFICSHLDQSDPGWADKGDIELGNWWKTMRQRGQVLRQYTFSANLKPNWGYGLPGP